MKFLKSVLLMMLLIFSISCETTKTEYIDTNTNIEITFPERPVSTIRPEIQWRAIGAEQFKDPIYGLYLKEYFGEEEVVYINLEDGKALATYFGDTVIERLEWINLVNYYIGIINELTGSEEPYLSLDEFKYLLED